MVSIVMKINSEGLCHWALLALKSIAISSLLGLAACSAPPQGVTETPPIKSIAAGDSSAPAKAASPRKYLVGVNDELEIKFIDQPLFNETVKVRPDGMISMGLTGTVRAEGLTPQEVEQEIIRRVQALGGSNGKGVKKSYLIRANDELAIKFSYMRSLDDTVKVLPDGKISLQLVKSVIAEGKSPEELTKELIQLYSKHLRLPDLVVIVTKASSSSYVADGQSLRSDVADLKPVVILKNYEPQQVFVGGEVTRPGVLPYRRSLTLNQALIEAGGNKATGEMRSVIVLRKGNDGRALTIRRDLSADLDADTTNDIYLEPFDIVVLPKSTIAKVAEALDQYVFSILPPVKNSSFSFVNDVTPAGRRTTTIVNP